MDIFNRLSLRAKLVLVIMVISLTIVTLVTAAFTVNDVKQLRSILLRDLSIAVDGAADEASYALTHNDLYTAQKAFNLLKANPHITTALILNNNNKILSRYDSGDEMENFISEFKIPDQHQGTFNGTAYHFDIDSLDMAKPLIVNGQQVGVLFVQSDLVLLYEDIIRNLVIALAILAAALMIALLMSSWMQKFISEPIISLASTMKQISRKRDYTLRARQASNDEIGTLITGFNRMLDQIQVHHNEQREAQSKIRQLAYYDSLTALPNRVLIKELLSVALTEADRENGLVAVMFLDLDNFKWINDTLGHNAGDSLLQMVAKRLKSCVRASDGINRNAESATGDMARLGGDEFTIVLKHMESANDIANVAQRMIDAVSKPYYILSNEVNVTTSIGIAVYPMDGKKVDVLLKNADVAMYHSKDSGKNSYHFFDEEMNQKMLQKINLEQDLRKAIERNEFEVYYQPKYDYNKDCIFGAEALIRWHHPERGFVSPDEFIPTAEDTGLIVEIGAWVLRTACLQAKQWQQSVFPDFSIAVNLSARQFSDEDLIQTISSSLEESGLAAEYLELELTEGVIMKSDQATLQLLQDIKAIGIRIALDDFGTGYSSLRYISQFPLDVLKIDRSFVQNILTAGNDASITKTIITLARNLKFSVIAEGVEELQQMHVLHEYGCDRFQGYLISRPLPVEDMTEFLSSELPFQVAG